MHKLKNWALASQVRLSLFVASLLAFAVGFAAPAGATAQYDLTPVTTSITSELQANIPVILGIVGGLIALGVGMRLVKKFTHAS